MLSFGWFPGVWGAGESPKRKHTTFSTRRKFEIKEIFLVGAFSRPQFHCPLSLRLVNAFWALRAPSFMTSWNISCYHRSHNLLLSRVGLCRFANKVLVCRRLLISDNQGHSCISPSWVCSGESDTGTCPPTLKVPFASLSIIPQLMSIYV